MTNFLSPAHSFGSLSSAICLPHELLYGHIRKFGTYCPFSTYLAVAHRKVGERWLEAIMTSQIPNAVH